MAWAATAWRSISPLPSRGQGRALFCQEEPRWRGSGKDVGEALANAGSRAMFPPAHDGWVGAQRNLTRAAAGRSLQGALEGPGARQGVIRIQTVLGAQPPGRVAENPCDRPRAEKHPPPSYLQPALFITLLPARAAALAARANIFTVSGHKTPRQQTRPAPRAPPAGNTPSARR